MTLTGQMLRGGFDGDIIEPGDAEYELVSGVKLAAGNPAYVLRPASVDGVQAAVRFASDAGFALAVRGGGHSFAGFGTNDGGVVIDLSRLADVTIVDHERRIVRVGGGATWGQVGAVLGEHGLAISAGDTKSVGVGGLTLSGGIGWKVRKYGLALDNLVSVDVVTADGSVVRANAEHNSELFWGVRGGGGNFGVATAFEFVAQPTTEVYFGTIAFPATEAHTVLRGWAEYLRGAPEELTSVAEFANPFAGPDAPVELHIAFDGDSAEAMAAAVDPIRRLGTVIKDDIALKPYLDILVDGATPPPGLKFVTRSAFVERESVADTLRILTEVAAEPGSPFMAVRGVGGAVSRVAADATAYAHRQAELMIMTTIAGPPPVVDAALPKLDALWQRLAQHVSGAYANFLTSAGEADVAAIYPPSTYARLAELKRRYDPDVLFAGNHTIRPA
jgi:FAD/FMN-containing dehydrogenase